MAIYIGFNMKKGWNINIDARSIHHDPTIHTDPDLFNPSRFPVSLSPLVQLNISYYDILMLTNQKLYKLFQ